MYGENQTSTKKCTYVPGPLNIDSITVALHELLSSLTSEKKCIFLDSVTTILLYNSLQRTIRFSIFLTQTLKNLGVDLVMISISKGAATERIIKELTNLCDEIISINAN